MAFIYDAIDATMSWNGDYELENGDLKNNIENGLRSLLDQIHMITASESRDWEFYPNRTARLDTYIGEPNTRSNAQRIKESLQIALISANIVNEQDLIIRVIPVHIHRLLIIIEIKAIPTPFNDLKNGEKLVTSLVFDSVEKQVHFLDKTPQLLAFQ